MGHARVAAILAAHNRRDLILACPRSWARKMCPISSWRASRILVNMGSGSP
jgi:hypothetical protein